MKNFSDTFNTYSMNGVRFSIMNKDIIYPDDKSLEFYASILIPEDIPWTILSYKLYGTIDYWWLLAGINRHKTGNTTSSIFYAPSGMTCYYIKKQYLNNFFTNAE